MTKPIGFQNVIAHHENSKQIQDLYCSTKVRTRCCMLLKCQANRCKNWMDSQVQFNFFQVSAKSEEDLISREEGAKDLAQRASQQIKELDDFTKKFVESLPKLPDDDEFRQVFGSSLIRDPLGKVDNFISTHFTNAFCSCPSIKWKMKPIVLAVP